MTLVREAGRSRPQKKTEAPLSGRSDNASRNSAATGVMLIARASSDALTSVGTMAPPGPRSCTVELVAVAGLMSPVNPTVIPLSMAAPPSIVVNPGDCANDVTP